MTRTISEGVNFEEGELGVWVSSVSTCTVATYRKVPAENNIAIPVIGT